MAAWQRGAERCVGPWSERAGKGRLHQIREFPTARAAERKLLCCWIIMRSRMGAGGGCGGDGACECLEKSGASSRSIRTM